MQELLGDDLSVVVNTGDDVEHLGVHVSPDPDLVTYWLAGEIDEERGWGIAGDSFTVFERLVALGAPDWFGLSDRDLATCLRRRERLEAGETHTAIQAEIARALGVAAAVLPMSDEAVRTHVRTDRGWLGLQEYLVREHAKPAVLEVELAGIEDARPSPDALSAIEAADAIVIGPSNPVISIGPILAVPGMRQAIAAAAAPVVAVSPYVGGRILKGPTDEFMRSAGREASTRGVAAAYEGLADGLVVDAGDPGPAPDAPSVRSVSTLMDDADARREVAAAVLDYARELG
jgi:LPPG:FO 2-phospho-L-lactate transferase